MAETRRLGAIYKEVIAPAHQGQSMTAIAAQIGHLLGRQALHLGDDPKRNAWFTCMNTGNEWKLGTLGLTGLADEVSEDPVLIDREYQRGLLGLLEDDEMRDYGIDPEKPVPSVFAVDWSGSWQVEAKAQTMHGFTMGIRLTFDQNANPPMVTMTRKKGGAQSFPAQFDGDQVRFKHMLGGQHRYVWTLLHGEDQCGGLIETHGPNRSIAWDITSCIRSLP
jgi:hypothetical protein